MPEPINTAGAGVSLMTLAIAVAGPAAGPYIVILLGSIGGALWALSSAALDTRMQGAWLTLRAGVNLGRKRRPDALVQAALDAGSQLTFVHNE